MRQTRDIMGMPVAVEIIGGDGEAMERVFEYFAYIDDTFSTYKSGSEISRINRGELAEEAYSEDMRTILLLAEETKRATHGFFDIGTKGGQDPSGIVKGWAINSAAELIRVMGYQNFYLEAGGDIQTSGTNAAGKEWRIGIRDPQDHEQIIKIIEPRGRGVATSGTAARGAHIWDPHTGHAVLSPYLSISVIGPDVYEADRFATAAFAMGDAGMSFIDTLQGFEAFAVLPGRTAVKTRGFAAYEV